MITALNTLCVASQLNPHVMSFVSLLAFARMGLVQEQISAARERSAVTAEGKWPLAWQPMAGCAGNPVVSGLRITPPLTATR